MRGSVGPGRAVRRRLEIVLLTVSLLAAPAVGSVAPETGFGAPAIDDGAPPPSDGSGGEPAATDDRAGEQRSYQDEVHAWIEAVLDLLGRDRQASDDQQVVTIVGFPAAPRIGPLGDADGDGHDDVLVSAWDDEAEATVYEARSGAAPGEAIWTLETPDDGYLNPGPDADGDAVRDLTLTRYLGSEGIGAGECAVVACAFARQHEDRRSVGLVAGASGEEAWANEYAWMGGYGSASGGAVAGFGYGSGSQSGHVSTLVRDGMPGTTYVVRSTYRSGSGFAYGVAAYLFAYGTDVDLAVDVLDAEGAVQASFEASDPTRTVAVPYVRPLADHTGDGVPDLAVASIERWPAGSAYARAAGVGTGVGTHVTRTDLTVFDGEDGSVAWSVEGDPVAGLTIPLSTVGDVTGDGAEDLYVVEVTALPETEPVFRSLIYSGADGAIVGERQGETAALAVPYGDADGDGTDEALIVEVDAQTSFVRLGPAGADLEPIWTVEADPSAIYTYAFEDAGARDWDGDGTADLALLTGLNRCCYLPGPGRSGPEEGDDEPPAFTVHDGATGEPLWSRDLPRTVIDHADHGDATGVGQRDLLLLTASGDSDLALDAAIEDSDFRNGSARLTLVRGEDGQRVWRQTVMNPEMAGNRTLEDLRFTVTSIGDVNADGAEDIAVQVRNVTYRGYVIAVSEAGPSGSRSADRTDQADQGDGEDAGDAGKEEMGQVLLLSGRDGEILFADPPLPDTSPAPEPEKLEGYNATGDVEGEPGAAAALPSPGAALVALAAAGAAVALATKRGWRRDR